MARRGRLSFLAMSAALVGAAVACVDLFHSTDFETLCTADAEACTAPATSDASDAVVDRKKPLIDLCQFDQSVALERATRACAWLGACAGGLGDTAFGPCMIRALAVYDCAANPALRPRGASEELWSCLSSVASCADVDACIFPDRVPECAGVTGGSFTACANDGVRLECGRPERGRATGVEPCVLFGKKCVKIDDSRAACVGTKGINCNVGAPLCEGTGAVQCDNDDPTRDRGLDCASVGSGTCVQDASFVACTPLGDAAGCTGTTPLACDDAGRAASCVEGRQIILDCTRLGLKCDPSRSLRGYDPVGACGDPAGGCTAADSCAGDTLKSCANNHSFEVACASVGLGTCGKQTNRLLPSCTPP